MAIKRLSIQDYLPLTQHELVLDVRSPGEFQHAHLPGAKSLPLFSDEERKVVGTAYKQESREQAIKIGLDYFGPKMRTMVEKVESLLTERSSASRTVLVYCWRGGMRSAGVGWLLDLYGFNVISLQGGYKSFRHWVLDSFEIPYSFRLLGGYTGSGKTELLQSMAANGKKVVDLEAIAVHRGSAFGNIGLPAQPSQEQFENLLALDLRKCREKDPSQPIWLEDESQRIGSVNLPGAVWRNMRKSPIYFLDIPFEERLSYLESVYGKLDPERMLHAIERIRKRLGHLQAKNAMDHLASGNIRECFRILLWYYDKWYLKSLHNREELNTLLHSIPCEQPGCANAPRLTELQ